MEVVVRPDLGKRPYRLHCHVTVEGGVRGSELHLAVGHCLDDFVRAMHQQGFEHVSSEPWRSHGMPKPHIKPMTLRRPARLSSRDMMPAVMQGARFRAGPETIALVVPRLEESELWDYDVSGVFLHDTILTDVPDLHEETH